MKLMKIIAVSALCSILGLAMVSAQEAKEKEPSKEEKAVTARQDMMHVLAAQRGILRDMADGKRDTDAVKFTNAATALAALAKMIPEAFTLNAIVGESTAKPEIWTKPDDFAAKASALSDKVGAIAKLAATDIEGAKAMVKDIKECGGCHDDYRVEEKQ